MDQTELIKWLDRERREIARALETSDGLAPIMPGHGQPAEIEPGVGVAGVFLDGPSPITLGLLIPAQSLACDTQELLEPRVIVTLKRVLEMRSRLLVPAQAHQVEREVSIEKRPRDVDRPQLGVELDRALGRRDRLGKVLSLVKRVGEQCLARRFLARDLEEPLGQGDDLASLPLTQSHRGQALQRGRVGRLASEQVVIDRGGLGGPIQKHEPECSLMQSGAIEQAGENEMTLGQRGLAEASKALGGHQMCPPIARMRLQVIPRAAKRDLVSPAGKRGGRLGLGIESLVGSPP